jgi:hypothetical protein
MNKISAGKLAALTLFATVTIGSICMVVNSTDKTEDTCAGAPVVTATVQEHTFDGSNAPEYAIPSGNTSFKSYMDYRAITNKNSAQWDLQTKCWTDKDGLRRKGDYYVVALGSYYADHIGDRFIVTLDTGVEIPVIVGDFKADKHTDATNRYTLTEDGRKNILEFVVDTQSLPEMARKMGDISYVGGFKGNVRSIERE